jgi:hypothetical protein
MGLSPIYNWGGHQLVENIGKYGTSLEIELMGLKPIYKWGAILWQNDPNDLYVKSF